MIYTFFQANRIKIYTISLISSKMLYFSLIKYEKDFASMNSFLCLANEKIF